MNAQTGGTILGVLAVAYGLFVAFGARGLAESVRGRVIVGGAIALLVLAVVLVLLPYLGVY